MHTHTLVLHQRFSNTRRWAIAMVAVLALTLGVVFAVQAAPLNCSGGPTTRTLDLWARTGTLALADGTVVNIYGYAANNTDPARLPGPTLKACAGDTVNVALHNVDLPSASSLAVHGQTGLPADMVGVTAGNSKTYVFTAHAGTFVYQAGLTVDGPTQAALGLYGALVVYPTTAGQAYGTAATAYNDESLVLLSEIDPALNGVVPAPISTTFEMHDYAPKYWLINGKVFSSTNPISSTDPIQAPANDKVLLRYANAGFLEHSMGMLGLDQTIIAANGYLLPYSHGVVAETVPPGSTLDAIMIMPASGTYPLYDANQHIDNNGASGFGGMFTLVSPGTSLGINAAASVAPAGVISTVDNPPAVNIAPKPVDNSQSGKSIIVPPAQ